MAGSKATIHVEVDGEPVRIDASYSGTKGTIDRAPGEGIVIDVDGRRVSIDVLAVTHPAPSFMKSQGAGDD